MKLQQLVGLSLFFIINSANADFTKALNAYQERDGTRLLVEIQNAVKAKNDSGLMLFLNALVIDNATSDFDPNSKLVNSTLNTILSETQRAYLLDLLLQATKNSSVDSQYFLLAKSPFQNGLIPKKFEDRYTNSSESDELSINSIEYQNQLSKQLSAKYSQLGSVLAKLDSSLTEKAEAGDPFSQMQLGLKYLNFRDYSEYGCDSSSAEIICQEKDEIKGNFWIKKAAKSYENSAHALIGTFADSMCDLFQQGSDKTQLHQAYLWCLMAINSGGVTSNRLLGKMHDSGKLFYIAPGLAKIWNDPAKRAHMLYRNELKDLPNWITEVRKESAIQLTAPAFSYLFDDRYPYALNVYQNGRVEIIFLKTSQNQAIGFPVLFMQVTPEVVKRFITDIEKTGFNEWPLYSSEGGFCDMNCSSITMQVVVRHGAKTRRLVLTSLRLNDWVDKNITTSRISKIKTVVDTYFPTQKLRFELGNSENIRRINLSREKQWDLLAKERE